MRKAPILSAWILLLAAGAASGATGFDLSTTLADCDALVKENREDLAGYQCYWFTGRNHSQLDAAAGRLEDLLEADPGNHRARLYLGIVLADLGSARAEELLVRAAEEFVSEEDAQGEVYARISLAMWLRHRGRTQEASAELEQALVAAAGGGDAALEAQVRINLGWQQYNEGDYGSAWRILKETEPLLEPDGRVQLRLDCLDALGAVSWALGRSSEALDYYRRELEILGGGDAFREAAIRRNMSLVARPMAADGRISDERLVQMFRDAVDAAVRAGNRYAETGARVLLASSLEGPEGLAEAERALDVALEISNLNDTCWALWLIGEKRLKLDPGQTERAFAPILEAIRLARMRASAELLAQGMLVQARMRWETGPHEQAVRDSFGALDAIERIRDLQPDGEVKARVMSRFANAYRWLQGMLLGSEQVASTPNLEAAFAVSERMRARSLLDTLDAAGATGLLTPSGPEVEQRLQILADIAAVRSDLARGESSDGEVERRLDRLAGLEDSEAELRSAIASKDERFASLRGTSLPELSAVQDALSPRQALVAFVVAIPTRETRKSGGSWVLVITSDDAVALRLGDLEGLDRKVRLYVSLLRRRDGLDSEGAERLYEYLLRGAVTTLPDHVDSLIVLPDGPLYRLPFGALVDGRSGLSVAERFELTIVPSTATWLRWKKAPAVKSRASLLAFADPTPLSDEHATLLPLPHARREVRGVMRRLGGKGRVLEGEAARETALKNEDLSRYGILHLAVHTLVNNEHPEQSAVLLSPDAIHDGNDGVVAFKEIVGLDLAGQVVVLSACRSASGPLIGGEGIMGLANAFFQAGARTVIAGLWPVRDRETASLVDRFAAHLAQGRSVSAALSLARRDLLRRGAPPASWAGLVVLGDGDIVLVPPEVSRRRRWTSASGIAVALVLLLTLIALAARLHRSRHHS